MKTILTGIKPTADQIHIGNYFGAVKPILELQKNNKIYFMIADLHALTTIHEKDAIGKSCLKQAKIYISCGIDYKKGVLFRQHKVPAHAELNRTLSCLTGFGQLRRMHAFKDAVSNKKQENISAGVFNYPTLMAADILLYDTQLVPVGVDQKQHVEYTKDIAQKFNNLYGETLVIPNELIKSNIAKIPGIDGRKMSKSYNNFIGILDNEEELLQTTKRIVSDSIPMGTTKNPDECNIYNILKHFLTEDEDKKIRENYNSGNFSFKDMKDLTFEKINYFVTPIRKKYNEITDEEVEKILQENEKIANETANNTMQKVYKAIGF